VKITILSFEKRSHSPYEGMIQEYKKRISSRFSIDERYLKVGADGSCGKEIELSLKNYKNSFVCLLDESGKDIDTRSFADMLLRLNETEKNITFIIGPHSGFEKPITFRYDMILSLSRMTFSHQIARLLLFEQIYRAFCYYCNHPYNR